MRDTVFWNIAGASARSGYLFRTWAVARCTALAILLVLGACGGGGSSSSSQTPTARGPAPSSSPPVSNAPFAFDSLGGMRESARAAIPGNSLETTLINCTVIVQNGNECTFNVLPLLGMETAAPTVTDVMNRVVVSHPWMANRFRQVLAVMPVEMLLLMRGLTAVVISHDIRPSFYTGQTGAIYLDPAGLWLTPEEQATVDTAPDFRAGFGSELQFTMLWRYVRNNEYATRTPSTGTRTVEDIRYRMAALLLHELGHANDFFSPARRAAFDRNLTVLSAALTGTIASSTLANTLPLQSSLMSSLARVSFRGASATAAQQTLTPGEIAGEFPFDAASDYYNYSTTREDYAMLFEEAMMLYLFGIDRDVGVTNRPPSGAPCGDYVVEWGVRNRVTNAEVRRRAVHVVEAVLPEAAVAVEQHLLGEMAPTPMIVGDDWCTNRLLDPPADLQPPGTAIAGQGAARRARAAGDPVPDSLIPYL